LAFIEDHHFLEPDHCYLIGLAWIDLEFTFIERSSLKQISLIADIIIVPVDSVGIIKDDLPNQDYSFFWRCELAGIMNKIISKNDFIEPF